MVDLTPSSDLDDLFGFSVPDSVPTPTASIPLDMTVFSTTPAARFPSRRELREAQGTRRSEAAPAAEPVLPSVADAAPAAVSRRDARAAATPVRRREASRPGSDRRAASRVSRPSDPPQPQGHKLRRSELALLQASTPKPTRKNPISVLATMAMVGGMFAVAALPAYAITSSSGSTTLADADAVTLHAQSMVVSSDVATLSTTRDGYHATTPEQLARASRDTLRAQYNATYLASGARELGDDYPWPYELRSYQGGGLSPLNYYYRECVDFVAWRLNRDQGSYEAPYKWVWANLTPSGGNASQWKYSWDAHGWPVSKTPIPGSVAWFGSANHVAYVKTVNADGTILIEEYNYFPGVYSQRTIPAASVTDFLYPPS